MSFEMKIKVDGIKKQIKNYSTLREVQNELKRKYIEHVIKNNNEVIITIRNLKTKILEVK